MKRGQFYIFLLGPRNGGPTPHDGRFLKRYEPPPLNPDRTWGPGCIETTAKMEDALGFDDAGVAYETYKQANGTRPYDGKPNRPLTAWTVEIAKYV